MTIWASNNPTCHLLHLCLMRQDHAVIKSVGVSESDTRVQTHPLPHVTWGGFIHTLCVTVSSVCKWSPPNRATGTTTWVWMRVKDLEHCLARVKEGLNTHLLLLLTPYYHIIVSEGRLQRGCLEHELLCRGLIVLTHSVPLVIRTTGRTAKER